MLLESRLYFGVIDLFQTFDLHLQNMVDNIGSLSSDADNLTDTKRSDILSFRRETKKYRKWQTYSRCIEQA